MSHRLSSHRRQAMVLVVTALYAVTACGFGTSGLAFSNDNRLHILAPKEREKLRLPLTVDWRIDDFDIAGPGVGSGDGYFAVFVDRSPVPPGKTLQHVARKDRTCRPADGCPDEEYLEARRIFTTTETELTLDTLPQNSPEGRREFHVVTVVLLDPAGRRISESAWQVRFEIDRDVRA